MFGFIKRWDLTNSVTLLRILIGWHFLYEGIIKLYNPEWTSFGYLATAQGPFKSIFQALSNESIIGIVDMLNIATLIIVGITLIMGIGEKIGAFMGAGLLLLYYFAHPPFPWLLQVNVEGSYWFVNKNLIEFAACLVLYQFPTGKYFGLQYFIDKNKGLSKNEAL